MKLEVNRIDTLAAYSHCKLNISDLINKGWKCYTPPENPNLISWYISRDSAFLRYYPNLYGKGTLYITFSIPKVYNGSSDNCQSVKDFDSAVLNIKLRDIMAPVIDLKQLPPSILTWEVSRVDLFHNHLVDNILKPLYMQAYSLTWLPKYTSLKYKNSSYLLSNLTKGKAASSVTRIYDKLLEMSQKSRNTPPGLEEDFDSAIEIVDDGGLYGIVRLEFQLRRRKLLYELGKLARPKRRSATVSDVFEDRFQKTVINDFVTKLGLNKAILSKANFLKTVHSIFGKRQASGIIETARLIRNNKNPKVSRKTLNNYIKLLENQNTHILTNSLKDLVPIMLLA